jgi:hypothetical protein
MRTFQSQLWVSAFSLATAAIVLGAMVSRAGEQVVTMMIQKMVVSLLDFSWKMVPGAAGARPAMHARPRRWCAHWECYSAHSTARTMLRPGRCAKRLAKAFAQCYKLRCARGLPSVVRTGQDFSLLHTNLPTPTGGLMIVNFRVRRSNHPDAT